MLLKEPYEAPAITPDGLPTTRLITIGQYKTAPNNVKTSTGGIYHFLPPEQVKPAMTDLIDRLRSQEASGEHAIIIAANLHYEFVRIHPFDDGNGRMARLLMNLILMKHGYPIAWSVGRPGKSTWTGLREPTGRKIELSSSNSSPPAASTR